MSIVHTGAKRDELKVASLATEPAFHRIGHRSHAWNVAGRLGSLAGSARVIKTLLNAVIDASRGRYDR